MESAVIVESFYPSKERQPSQATQKTPNRCYSTTLAGLPGESPSYWIKPSQRPLSIASVDSADYAITLRDNTKGDSSKQKICWAKSAHIENHVIISDNRTDIGAFVVWKITVEMMQGGKMYITKRYSEFDRLRQDLVRAYPYFRAAMPTLPRKSVISKFRPKFLENRRSGLQYFLKFLRSVKPRICWISCTRAVPFSLRSNLGSRNTSNILRYEKSHIRCKKS
ncbi:PX domain-containing protein [Blumeria hordei DH14]|uniref:PX domain-containing protein n=1 Tax=Blumeria graminis f. sp. hordei (strain DH14) TaxID=546991 RepID=N1JLL8_BLUG1|nr:PX domain-containing protein [Blumeria hordei DH14]